MFLRLEQTDAPERGMAIEGSLDPPYGPLKDTSMPERCAKFISYVVASLQLAATIVGQTEPGGGLQADARGGEMIAEWTRQVQSGQRYYEHRQLSESERCFRSALLIAQQFPDSNVRLGTTLSRLGTVLHEQGRLSEADGFHTGAVAALRKCADGCRPGLARALQSLAALYDQQNRRFEAEQLLVEALALYTRANLTADGAEVLNRLGWIELFRQRPASAELHFQRGLMLVRDLKGAEEIRGNLYASLSTALLKLHRNRSAVEAAQQALTAVASVPAIDRDTIVRHKCTLAAVSSAAGDYALAEASLTQALELMSNHAEASPPTLGFVLVVFGGLRGLQRRFTEAAEFHEKAIGILERHLSQNTRRCSPSGPITQPFFESSTANRRRHKLSTTFASRRRRQPPMRERGARSICSICSAKQSRTGPCSPSNYKVRSGYRCLNRPVQITASY